METGRIKRIEFIGAALTALAGIAGVCVAPSVSIGLVLGGLVMMANFHLLATILRQVLTPGADAPVKLVAAFLLKFVFLFGSFAILIIVLKVNPLILALGSSTLLLAIVGESLCPAPERR